MKRMLVVTAHPDDEVGGFGGTLMKYRADGVETSVISLTAGEAGTHRGHAKSDADLAELRRAELAAAANILKLSQAWVLDYKDGALDRENLYRVVGDLVRRIRELRPQVVLTFGPEGAVTGHPDHSMASAFATLAFQWAGRKNRYADQLWDGLEVHRPQKLYYQTTASLIPDRPPISPAPITCDIDIREWIDEKIRAFKQHSSQAPLFDTFEAYARLRLKESFHLAATTSPRSMEVETDLFTGVEE
ncbi:LmbE-like protein [Candidatus Koribacter versatilis Ellin345]|uniref:LmbE-like protein n=1 Tax=Koribacter versatilis (strain Ellin345) TaxID=204669 RepID=Q1IML9_KORVE|nr:PIG-L family deacetylase [Candidatus Koribacter versatilis]ABF41881.1 LmbE-like protein [Candidatus Koribacter versatilis Ellin345]